MVELKEVFLILLFTILQGSYDYLGWGLIILEWLKVKEDSKTAKTYRVIKETLDFVLTPYIMIVVMTLQWHVIFWFYALKVCHSCDRWYNKIDKWRGVEPGFWGHWRWWTFPYGWLRTVWDSELRLKKQMGYTYKDYITRRGMFGDRNNEDACVIFTDWNARKGMVNLDEVDKVNNIAWSLCLLFYIIKGLINVIYQ